MLKNNVKFKLIVAYKCRQTSFYCTLLYCTSQILCFLKIEGLWQPNIEQVCQCNFPSSICSFCVYRSVQFSSVTQPYLTLCDPMDCSTPGLPVHHQLLELAQTHVHQVRDHTHTHTHTDTHTCHTHTPPTHKHTPYTQT